MQLQNVLDSYARLIFTKLPAVNKEIKVVIYFGEDILQADLLSPRNQLTQDQIGSLHGKCMISEAAQKGN